MKYRTRSRVYFFRRYSLVIITVLVLALAATAVWAQNKPPQTLFEMVTTTAKLVHAGTCNLPQKQVKEAMCIMYHDEGRDLIYMVLFVPRNGGHDVTHVFAINKKDEVTTLWVHPQHTT